MFVVMSTATLSTLESLLRAKKLDVTLVSASRPWSREEREARLAPTGWAAVDAALGGGLPRGECSEIVGPPSSGRTALVASLLAAAGTRDEVVALVDTLDSFDPVSAAAMGVDLSRLLWARGMMIPPRHIRVPHTREARDRNLLTRAIDRAIKAFGLVLQAGGGGGPDAGGTAGFGVVVLDLADVPIAVVRRLPFTTWLRVQRLLEGRDTVGIVLAQDPIARSARGVTIRLTGASASEAVWTGASNRTRLFAGFSLRPRVVSGHRIEAR
jgi:recA bacterial DNA recombination protein